MLLTDDEILDAINDAPLAQGPGTFVLAVGRAIERRVLEKQREQATVDPLFAAAHFQDGRDLVVQSDSHAPPVGVPASSPRSRA
jgi:hypothetical protein